MNVVLAIDSFKGSLSSVEAGAAAAEGVRCAFPDATCVVRPLADGGEGTVDALVAGMGGELRRVTVTGPVGRPVEAAYGMLPGGTAVMEMAAAAGITLVAGAEKNPLFTTTYGVGEMILDAFRNGCRRFVVGIGGSATNDAGAGMLQALGFRLLDANGKEVPRGGAGLARVAKVVAPGLGGVGGATPPPGEAAHSRAVRPELRQTDLSGCTFRIACDVTNPLCGERGASAVFGPQKGATPAMVAELDAALAHFASVAGDDATQPGDGAAGGLGFAFRRFLGGELVHGVDLIVSETKLEDYVRGADMVVTGEGRLDAQTVMGKAPIGVARVAKKYGKRVIAFSGCVSDDAGVVNEHGIDAYFPIAPGAVSLADALDKTNAAANLKRTAEQAFRLLRA